MKQDDLLRNSEWNRDIQKHLDEKISRQRSNYKKAQTLSTKGGLLLFHSTDPKAQVAGVKLLQRILKDYPDEREMRLGALESLARHFARIDSPKEAISYYEEILGRYISENSRSWTSGMADLDLADLVLEEGLVEKYKGLYDYFLKLYLSIGHIDPSALNIPMARYYKIMAHFHYHFKKYEDCIQSAEHVLVIFDKYLRELGTNGDQYFDFEDISVMRYLITESHIALID
jgi:tetratricopeptide (TPR) repeat protein